MYPGFDWDLVEQGELRIEIEAQGIPMGYGRVWRLPSQLDDLEAGAQFDKVSSPPRE